MTDNNTAMLETYHAVGRIEEKLDGLVERQREDRARTKDLEKRMDVHDRRWWKATGAAAVVGAVFTWAASHLPIPNWG